MWGGLRVCLIAIAYLVLGCVFYHLAEEKECDSGSGCIHGTEAWTLVDALYFSVVTISTVGYGDLTPSNDLSKVFTIFYIFFGITVVFAEVANALSNGLATMECMFLKLIDRWDTTGGFDGAPVVNDGASQKYLSGQQAGLSGKKVDLSGNGHADFIFPPSASVFWTQRLLPWVSLALVFQFCCSAVFCLTEPGLSYFDAFYHSFVTATTVGYGDISLSTQDSKLFAVLHIILSVTFFAALIGRIQELVSLRNSELQRAIVFEKELDEDWIASICSDMDNDGKGVDKVEFVVGMLTKLGVELCGQALTWDDIRPMLAQFEAADKTNDGRLNQEDLRKMTQAKKTRISFKKDCPGAGSKVAPDAVGAMAAPSPMPSPCPPEEKQVSVAPDPPGENPQTQLTS